MANSKAIDISSSKTKFIIEVSKKDYKKLKTFEKHLKNGDLSIHDDKNDKD